MGASLLIIMPRAFDVRAPTAGKIQQSRFPIISHSPALILKVFFQILSIVIYKRIPAINPRLQGFTKEKKTRGVAVVR
jgi:hypothetical protein